MRDELRTCQSCKQEFTIAASDFAFYEKMNVPPPKFCYHCRRQRLVCWRNQRTLYGRTCAATKKQIISIFAPESDYVVYDRDYWWTDVWDPLSYGQEIDFSKPFAEQFDALLHRVPLPAVINGKSENSQYSNHVGFAKNCYLLFASWEVENTYYSDMTGKTKDSMDIMQCTEMESGYELVGCVGSYNLKYSIESDHCIDSAFLHECKSCTNCIGCTNLRNKQYYIFNKPYSKSEYEKAVQELRLDTRAGIENVRAKMHELKKASLHKFATLTKAEDSTGNDLMAVKNCRYCFAGAGAENSAYCTNIAPDMRDVYDGYGVGATLERGYYLFDSGDKGMENMFCGTVWGSQYVYYAYQCFSSFELFGCVGVRGKKHCILNKQYSKEEYDALKAKLIAHMKETGEWGEFFPPSISPFGYNETLAQEYVPLTKGQALAGGFKWQDRVPGTFGKETLKPEQIPETIADVQDSILKEVLGCVDCKKNYKIMPQELAFYRKHNLPIPLYCPECRYRARLALREPHDLWHRRCQCAGAASEKGIFKNTGTHVHGAAHCENEFETSYSPERDEIVYCEACYNSEIL